MASALALLAARSGRRRGVIGIVASAARSFSTDAPLRAGEPPHAATPGKYVRPSRQLRIDSALT